MGNRGFNFYFNFKLSEKNFIELRDLTREELLKLGMNIEDIQKVTKLTKEEIEQLK